jgi:predicted DNA-binding protein (MmcQ/YjbR family)
MHADIEWVRELCLTFPGATEQVTWGADLTFRISGKIFAVTVLEPAKVWLSFKCSPENFAELTERAGIIPAPYLARAQWVALESKDALRRDELAGLLRESYELVFAKLPKKSQQALLTPKIKRSRRASRRSGKGKSRKRNT